MVGHVACSAVPAGSHVTVTCPVLPVPSSTVYVTPPDVGSYTIPDVQSEKASLHTALDACVIYDAAVHAPKFATHQLKTKSKVPDGTPLMSCVIPGHVAGSIEVKSMVPMGVPGTVQSGPMVGAAADGLERRRIRRASENMFYFL